MNIWKLYCARCIISTNNAIFYSNEMVNPLSFRDANNIKRLVHSSQPFFHQYIRLTNLHISNTLRAVSIEKLLVHLKHFSNKNEKIFNGESIWRILFKNREEKWDFRIIQLPLNYRNKTTKTKQRGNAQLNMHRFIHYNSLSAIILS